MIKRVLSIQKRERGTAPFAVCVCRPQTSRNATRRTLQCPHGHGLGRAGRSVPQAKVGHLLHAATTRSQQGHLPVRHRNLDDAARLLAQALERKREVLGNGHITVGILEYEMSGVAQEMAKFNTGTRTHHRKTFSMPHIDTTRHDNTTRTPYPLAISCLKRVRSIFALIPAAKYVV